MGPSAAHAGTRTAARIAGGEDLRGRMPACAEAVFPPEESGRFGFGVQPLTAINLGMNLWNEMPGVKKTLEISFIPFIALLIVVLASIVHGVVRRAVHGLREQGAISPSVETLVPMAPPPITTTLACVFIGFFSFGVEKMLLKSIWFLPTIYGALARGLSEQ